MSIEEDNDEKILKEEKEKQVLEEQFENLKKVEINRYYYFNLPYPPNRKIINEEKYYEHGAHFKYMDLFSKLINLVLYIPSERLGDGEEFIQNDKEKIKNISEQYFKVMHRKKNRTFHKSLLHSIRDMNSFNNKILSQDYKENSKLSKSKLSAFNNANSLNKAISLKHKGAIPIKLYKSPYKKCFEMDKNNNDEANKGKKSRVLSFDKEINTPNKIFRSNQQDKNQTLPSLNYSTSFKNNISDKKNSNNLRIRNLKKQNCFSPFSMFSTYNQSKNKNQIFSPKVSRDYRRSIHFHVFGDKVLSGDPDKILDKDMRPFIKFVD